MNKKSRPQKTRYSIRLEDAKVNFLKEIYGDLGFTELIETLIDERIAGIKAPPNKVRSPILRIGGKANIASKIVEVFPQHECFVDVFMGACHVTFNKPQDISKVEVINDKDEGITNLFRVIRDNPIQLREKILQMPVSRQYFKELYKMNPLPEDAIFMAMRTFYLIRNSQYGDPRNGFRTYANKKPSKTMARIADELVFISERLKDVIIENMDYSKLIKKYDSIGKENVLYYIDPPYIVKYRKSGYYDIPFTYEDNKKLCELVKKVRGKVILSHYKCKEYDEWLADWHKIEIVTHKSSSKVTDGVKERVVECLYCNFDPNAPKKVYVQP